MSTLHQLPTPSSSPSPLTQDNSQQPTGATWPESIQKVPATPPAGASAPQASPPNIYEPAAVTSLPASPQNSVNSPGASFQPMLAASQENTWTASSSATVPEAQQHFQGADVPVGLPTAPSTQAPSTNSGELELTPQKRKSDFLGGFLITLALLVSLGSVGLLAACLLDTMPPLPGWLDLPWLNFIK